MQIKSFTFLLISAILLFSFSSDAQDEGCGTVDSEDFRFEPNFKDKVKTRSPEMQIPVSLHIIRFSQGIGGLNPLIVDNIMEGLNEAYLETEIEFFLCNGSPLFIDSTAILDVVKGTQTDLIAAKFNVPNTLNIYVPSEVEGSDGSICGFATFPWYLPRDHIFVKRSCMTNGSTLEHEVGHYLGLYHTHSSSFGNELVNGSNCAFAGDRMCDTPADPRLSSSVVNSSCEYTGDDTDSNGDIYAPDATNIMSYSLKACRDYFSPSQVERMIQYRETARDYLGCAPLTSTKNFLDKSEYMVFPNPVEDVLTIKQVGGGTATALYHVLDMKGELIDSGVLENGQRRIATQYPSGIYVLNLVTDKGMVTYRIVKM